MIPLIWFSDSQKKKKPGGGKDAKKTNKSNNKVGDARCSVCFLCTYDIAFKKVVISACTSLSKLYRAVSRNNVEPPNLF